MSLLELASSTRPMTPPKTRSHLQPPYRNYPQVYPACCILTHLRQPVRSLEFDTRLLVLDRILCYMPPMRSRTNLEGLYRTLKTNHPPHSPRRQRAVSVLRQRRYARSDVVGHPNHRDWGTLFFILVRRVVGRREATWATVAGHPVLDFGRTGTIPGR